jgi:hypothetical protein
MKQQQNIASPMANIIEENNRKRNFMRILCCSHRLKHRMEYSIEKCNDLIGNQTTTFQLAA